MRTIGKTVLALAAALSFGCGGGDGIIVGMVINGQTGEPLNMFEDDGTLANLSDNSDATKQVYTIIDGKFVRAVPCGQGDINETNKIPANGCFKLGGIRFGDQLPVFARADGFEPFQGRVDYPAPITDGAGNNVAAPVEQIVRNIRLFPRNFQVEYKIFVHKGGRGINGVTVACQIRQATNSFRTDGTFIAPDNTGSKAITLTTANDGTFGDGFAKIGGGDLVLGANYHCEAFRTDAYEPTAGAKMAVLSGEADFVAGVDAPDVAIAVTANNSPDDTDLLYVLWSNADDATDFLGPSGQLKVTFNRPIELMPNTQDCQTYSVVSPDYNGSGNQPPQAPIDVPRSGGSEQVNANISDTLLTVAFRSPNPSFDLGDIGTFVTFSGIYVRVKGDQRTDASVVRYIGAPASNGCYASAVTATAARNLRTGGNQTNRINLF